MARYLSGSERLGGSRLVDSYVQFRAAADAASGQGSVEVIGPDGRRKLSLSEARTAQTLRLEQAGFYQIRLANGRDMLIGVNPDRRESDLQPIAEDVQRLWSGSASGAFPFCCKMLPRLLSASGNCGRVLIARRSIVAASSSRPSNSSTVAASFIASA